VKEIARAALEQTKETMFREPDPLVMYIMRHFEDVVSDRQSLLNRAKAAVEDYQQK